jgi:hypothetical protein
VSGFGLAPEKPEGGSYCQSCAASAGPGYELKHKEWCDAGQERPAPPEWLITGTFKLSMHAYAETPSEAIQALSDALAAFEHERIDTINCKQVNP